MTKTYDEYLINEIDEATEMMAFCQDLGLDELYQKVSQHRDWLTAKLKELYN